ncbi:histidine--tRNA ligase [Candidatus Woesearchaeota archaeon]|nr:histidine--tRNA ligase [Candidatus Woesearchaeota archaeon]
MKLELPRGMRDFCPEEKILRDEIVGRLKSVFERFGYNPIETPVIERQSVLASKFAGGAEILKEMFTLKDQGRRDLGLRYDLTVPFARFVGMNPTLKMPFKRYQIEKVYRDGPIKSGRYREFIQCDVDVVGCKGMTAEAELLQLTLMAFNELGLDVKVEVNNRKLLNEILETAGVPKAKQMDSILIVDKLKKIGSKEVRKELSGLGLQNKAVGALLGFLEIAGTNTEKTRTLKECLGEKEGLNEVEELFRLIDSRKIVFNPSLARGLSYYTGTVFEVFVRGSSITSSFAGGGRYDSMIPELLGSKQDYPAVGISFGLEPITEELKLKRSIMKTKTQVYIIPIQTQKECFAIAEQLRRKGINADMDIVSRGISKNLNFVNTMGIPYAAIIGLKELEKNKVNLRDMRSGKEELLSVEQIVKKFEH